MEKWIKCNVEDCQVVITGICVRQSTDNHDNGGEENKYELIALMTIPKDKKVSFYVDVYGVGNNDELFNLNLNISHVLLEEIPRGYFQKISSRRSSELQNERQKIKKVIVKTTIPGAKIKEVYRSTFKVSEEYLCEFEKIEWCSRKVN